MVQILNKINLVPIFDRLLPGYLEKYASHIQWDVNYLALPSSAIEKEPQSSNFYISRKQMVADDHAIFPNPFGDNLAIVLQGPIVSEKSITLRIIHHYLRRYPEVCIVVSTWEKTPPSDLDPLNKLAENGKIKLILNPDPIQPGVFNINRQIISSRNGLEFALTDFEFSIKSRTDQVFVDPRFLNQLRILFDRYSVDDSKNSRIVVSSLNTFAFRLYGASDMFQFGKTKDLFEYWNQPLDSRNIDELTAISPNLVAEAQKLVAEVYLNTNYFKLKEKKSPQYNLEESLHFLANYFVVADAQSLGHIWLKNTNLANRWSISRFPSKFYELGHTDWVGLTSDLSEWKSYEKLLVSESFFHE